LDKNDREAYSLPFAVNTMEITEISSEDDLPELPSPKIHLFFPRKPSRTMSSLLQPQRIKHFFIDTASE
jgi:hypothetical protein